MRRGRGSIGMVVLGVAALLALYALPRLWAPREVVAWRTDFTAARAEAARVHKPVMVYFTADWCSYCREMAHTTWADPGVAAALREYVPVKIDADQNPALTDHYGVQGLPTMAVLDTNGDSVQFASGAMSSSRFLAWLKSGQKAPRESPATQP